MWELHILNFIPSPHFPSKFVHPSYTWYFPLVVWRHLSMSKIKCLFLFNFPHFRVWQVCPSSCPGQNLGAILDSPLSLTTPPINPTFKNVSRILSFYITSTPTARPEPPCPSSTWNLPSALHFSQSKSPNRTRSLLTCLLQVCGTRPPPSLLAPSTQPPWNPPIYQNCSCLRAFVLPIPCA